MIEKIVDNFTKHPKTTFYGIGIAAMGFAGYELLSYKPYGAILLGVAGLASVVLGALAKDPS